MKRHLVKAQRKYLKKCLVLLVWSGSYRLTGQMWYKANEDKGGFLGPKKDKYKVWHYINIEAMIQIQQN